jgi:RNA polymerase sigma-70 factor (ECF subfamily)
LEYEYDGKITVQVFPDQQSFDKSAARKGMQGSPAYSDQGLIILVSPDSPIAVELPREERLMMAVHEYVHITLGAINGDTPIWLNEGIASYLGSADNYDSFCRYAFPQLAEIDFDKLWDSYYELPAPDVYSCAAVRFIIERFGYDTLNELVRNPDEFESILSMTNDEFSAAWNDYIRKSFKSA